MTESTTPEAAPLPPQEPTPAPKSTPEATTAESDVYAVYDTVFQRFVGGTHPTKAKADAAAKEGVKNKTIRKAQVRKV